MILYIILENYLSFFSISWWLSDIFCWIALILDNLCKYVLASFYHSFLPNWVSRRKEDRYWSRWRSAPSEQSCQFSCRRGRHADSPFLMLPATPCSSAHYGSRSITSYGMVWRCPLSASVSTNFYRNSQKKKTARKTFINIIQTIYIFSFRKYISAI